MSLCGKNVLLKQGYTGLRIGETQKLLKQLGFYTYSVDESYGPKTYQAVYNFQSRVGLKATGEVDYETCTKLTSMTGATTTDTTKTSGDVFDCPNTYLKKDSKETDKIKILQTYLNQWGYYKDAIDGIFGTETENAVKAFQGDTGHDQDGEFGPKTCPDFVKKVKTQSEAKKVSPYVFGSTLPKIPLYARYIKGKLTLYPDVIVEDEIEVEVQTTTTDTTSTTDTTATDTTDTDSIDTTDTTTAEPTTTKTTIKRYRIQEIGMGKTSPQKNGGLNCTNINLSNGSSGDNVTTLQTGLAKMGYYNSKIDGNFGPVTEAAVIALQNASGVTPDGIFGPVTCPYFNQRLGISTSTATGKSTSKKDKFIIMDLINPNPNSDIEGLTHDCTLRTPYTQEKLLRMQIMQRCKLELIQDEEVVYESDGYISDLKIVQENGAFLIELSLSGFNLFLEQDFAEYSGTKKQTEHLKDICKEIGLMLKLELNGLKDEDIEINVAAAASGDAGGGGGGKTVQMSNNDCNPSDKTESDTWADHRCRPPRCTAKSKVAHGNSSRQYATDTASHNSTSKALVEYVKSRCQYEYINGQPYGDNPWGESHCPDTMWKKNIVKGNCADFARMLKCILDVNGYKSIICHIPGHFYNAIWENGAWTVCDLCNDHAYGNANHGSQKPEGTWDNPLPRKWVSGN